MTMKNIYQYFKEINKLNEIVRTGWVMRNIKLERRESVGEHIFTMALLSLSVIDKYDLKLNVEKVLKMILIHELGEIDVGDISLMDTEGIKTKHEKELKGVTRIAEVIKEPWILELWKEFEEKKTDEAKFAYKMDKLQAIIQAKYYSENLNDNNKLFNEFYSTSIHLCEEFKELLD